ncbi:hypothetical protein L211DRAFT_850540 [Terfezia boudieri ATCC MYA-4762]|uniref:Uncharacterized protein n=1 Tax=Terfezia boudieri ATCC MYA-4762 TaxID=1051890 RepID=A0A3N4LIC6_9PEZI|nr:hypothetical protein L211DRAFT_850540 [Terfezia boudieri ATCC MYA-4762]
MTPPIPPQESQNSEQPEFQSLSLTDSKSSPKLLPRVLQDTDLVQPSGGAVSEISNSGESDSESDSESDTESYSADYESHYESYYESDEVSDDESSGVSDYESDEESDCLSEELGYTSTESEGESHSDSGDTSDDTESDYESDSEYGTLGSSEDSELEQSGSEESESGSEDGRTHQQLAEQTKSIVTLECSPQLDKGDREGCRRASGTFHERQQ